MAAHLLGRDTLGAYVLDAAGQASYVVLDADDDDGWDALLSLAGGLERQGIPAYCETSRRGGHLWFFFHEPLSAQQARQFGLGLLHRHGLPDMEVFPKQSRLGNGPGSLVRLPFGVHRKSGERYGFITPERAPLASTLQEQIERLAEPLFVYAKARDTYVRHAPRAHRRSSQSSPVLSGSALSKSARSGPANAELRPSDRIKTAVNLREFIAQYVELSSSGTGHCPFHQDEVASFSINEEEQYWYCFGCGRGGSIIDFWMHYRHCGFKQALRELCHILSI